MKKTITKISVAMVVMLVLISAGIIFKKAFEKEVAQMRRALERHLELPSASTLELRKEMLTLETIPKEHKEKARNKLYRDLLEVTTEDYAKMIAVNRMGQIEGLEQEGGRLIDAGVKVLAIEAIEIESPDKAHIVAIVWNGGKYGKFNKALKKTELLYEVDNTSVRRYPMQKIDGKWKVTGIWTLAKGSPLDGDDNAYGPPTPEEAIKMFENIGYTWDEKMRRGIPLGW